jgi:hypothetical protein
VKESEQEYEQEYEQECEKEEHTLNVLYFPFSESTPLHSIVYGLMQ